MFGHIAWVVGLVLLVLGGAASVFGLLGKALRPTIVDDSEDGYFELDGPSKTEAAQWQRDQTWRLRLTLSGALLANVGGIIAAFGTQPWSAGN